MTYEARTEMNRSATEWFKRESLAQLAGQLAVTSRAGYPALADRLWIPEEDLESVFYPLHVPLGPWETSAGEVPPIPCQTELSRQGLTFDSHGRPLHPWFQTMLTDPRLGLATGKGEYWRWGPNRTADPIVLRHDTGEPRLLLIQRGDGSDMWALPGGFIDKGEGALDAALREAEEEAQRADDGMPTVPLSQLAAVITPVYQGPVADIRMTANAWPETSAFRFDLADEAASPLPLGPYRVKEEEANGAKQAAWVPLDRLPPLFGSHDLLVKLALGEEERL